MEEMYIFEVWVIDEMQKWSSHLTHWLLEVPHWRVKLSGIRQSKNKILSLAGLGRFGCQRVN